VADRREGGREGGRAFDSRWRRTARGHVAVVSRLSLSCQCIIACWFDIFKTLLETTHECNRVSLYLLIWFVTNLLHYIQHNRNRKQQCVVVSVFCHNLET